VPKGRDLVQELIDERQTRRRVNDADIVVDAWRSSRWLANRLLADRAYRA
jgi:hypothetical protein